MLKKLGVSLQFAFPLNTKAVLMSTMMCRQKVGRCLLSPPPPIGNLRPPFPLIPAPNFANDEEEFLPLCGGGLEDLKNI